MCTGTTRSLIVSVAAIDSQVTTRMMLQEMDVVGVIGRDGESGAGTTVPLQHLDVHREGLRIFLDKDWEMHTIGKKHFLLPLLDHPIG